MAEDEAKPELPRTLGGRYRPRWKDPVPGSPEGTKPSLVARDTVADHGELELARVPFGPDRAKERDALVSSLKARTTVLSPALVAVHDAGEWQDDAFVVNEQVEAPRSIEAALKGDAPTSSERLGWMRALADAALVVDEAGLSIDGQRWGQTSIDAYRNPRVRGLDEAVDATDQTRAATLEALGALLERLSPDAASDDAADREARAAVSSIAKRAHEGAITLRELRDALSPLVGAADPERPLIANVDAASLQKRQTRVLIAGLALFVLSFVVLVAVLASTR